MDTIAQIILEQRDEDKGSDKDVLIGLAITSCIGQRSDYELGIFEYDFRDGSVLILRNNHPAVAFGPR